DPTPPGEPAATVAGCSATAGSAGPGARRASPA
ncbi:PE family protein, partial [Mycobacterium tuberculosis]